MDEALFANGMPRAVSLAHDVIRSRVSKGDTVVDATVGNGHDTLFLARLVGPGGKVIGCDIQEVALQATRKRLPEEAQVDLFHEGHEFLADRLVRSVKAVMFNLGYLPGSDKKVVTAASTTIAALTGLSEKLDLGGVITVVLYTGHPGGGEEAEQVAEWAEQLDQSRYTSVQYRFLNQKNCPPSLIVVEQKLSG